PRPPQPLGDRRAVSQVTPQRQPSVALVARLAPDNAGARAQLRRLQHGRNSTTGIRQNAGSARRPAAYFTSADRTGSFTQTGERKRPFSGVPGDPGPTRETRSIWARRSFAVTPTVDLGRFTWDPQRPAQGRWPITSGERVDDDEYLLRLDAVRSEDD